MLLCLGLWSQGPAAEIGDIRVPFQVNSQYAVRVEEGPPANCNGLNKFAPCYLFKFSKTKYRRDISFSPASNYVTLKDYYGEYGLSSLHTVAIPNFVNFRRGYALNDSWQKDLRQELGKSTAEGGKGAVQIDIPWQAPPIVQGIIGEGRSNIKVTGTRSISFSGRSEWEDGLQNTGTFKQSKFPSLQMEQKSRFKVTGTIGSKITVEVDQDSQRDVELANTIKLRYKGDEDEILQSIEAGNTNLALPNAQFIGYSQNVQGLFGIKSTAKIGNLDMTVITSQEKGSSEKATFSAGARGTSKPLRDYEYLAYTYFWLGPHTEFDSLLSVELYTDGTWPTNPHGVATVNPDSLPNLSGPERNRNEFEYTALAQYDPTQFDVYKMNWFVVLNQQLRSDAVLGAYIKYARYVGGHVDTLTIGNLNYRSADTSGQDTTLVLRLIKARTPDTSFATWNLMWRNVYDLGSRNISPDGFQLKIYKGQGDTIRDPEDQDDHCFVTLLGLDRLNNNTNTEGADCIFDFNNTTLDAARGYVIFPEQFPFKSDSLQEKALEIYDHPPNYAQMSSLTKYYIVVKSSQRSSSFSLGRANIMEGSEVVKLSDGTVLRRGVDYEIDYDLGQITFLNDQALNPAANVSVDFEYAPFFMPEKKTLFGMAGQYKLWENSNISLAGMYRSESASEPRPRVGREPRRGFVWDSNFSFNFKPGLMTSMVDALPLVETDAPSDLTITGEVAQSFPNPNLKNEAFIDDFEGTRTYTDLSNRRVMWTVSSPPMMEDGTRVDLAYRGTIWWYNPFDPLTIKSIWPEREVKSQDDRQDVLILNYFPDTSLVQPESSWAGIMRPLYSGLADQSLTKFIEVWYRPDSSFFGDNPTLHLDFGMISEDINDDGNLNSEDRLNAGARGVFEPDEEDTGLDGLFDSDELGYNPATNPDPNHDDWRYDNDNHDDFSHINGTEGSKDDADRRGRFDTEDINNNGSLDRQNGYFEYAVHLNDNQFLVDSTSTGWKLLRIPFQDSTVYQVRGNRGSADFTRISFARIWFDGTTYPYQLAIASFQLVGNKWQEMSIAFPEGDTLGADEKFEITVKNTQENTNYDPPPGVAGNLDRETGIREKEQSLVLSYRDMAPGHVGGAYWNLYQGEDYTQYQRLKMYVHGDSTTSSGKLTFFFRMSQDGNNYYEYHSVLEPGWTTNNAVDIDFAKLTELKYEMQKRTAPESLGVADTTDGHYAIFGNPTLSQVKWFIVGVEIAGDAPSAYSGEVWIDELRVTDIRRNSDYAGRVQLSAKFSDFADVAMSYSRVGADFYPLSARAPSGSTNIGKSARMNVKLDKLAPPSMGLSLPVTLTWQSTISLPRLKPGSDIILPGAFREEERSENKSIGYTVSQAFNRNTKNWLWNSTLNRIRTSYTFTRTEGRSPSSPENLNDSYRGTGNYDMSPKSKPSFKPFFWGKYLMFPEKVYNSQFFYLPTQLSFGGEVNGRRTSSLSQRGISTETRVKDLALSANTTLNLFSSLRTAYSISSNRDISEPGRIRLSINPSKLRLGREQSFQQRFETSFQPKIIQVIDNRFSFNSTYAENSDLKRSPDSTRTTQLSSSFKTELTFNLQTLLSSGGKPSRPKEPDLNKAGVPDEKKGIGVPGDDLSRDQDKPQEEDNGDGSPRAGSPKWIFRQFVGIVRSIKPVRGSFQKDRRLSLQGLLERPSWSYVFGLTENPRARSKVALGQVSPSQSVFTDTYNLDSGLQPGHGLDVNSGYSRRKTITRSSTDPVMTSSVTFPDVTLTVSGLEKLSLFKKFSSSVGFQCGYSRKVDENGRADTGELYKRDTSTLWAPLGSLNVNLKNSVKVTLRYDLSKTLSENLRQEGQAKRDVRGNDGTLKLSVTYSFTAPQGLKLPLLKRVKFNSQMSLSMDITSKSSKAKSVTAGVESVDANRSQLVVEPRLSYQFSKAITGAIRARWDDSNDKIQKRKHHIRELGISAEIRF